MNVKSEERFLTQVFERAWARYMKTIRGEMPGWDYVIITASNKGQAEGFAAQLADRRENGFLPEATHFGIVPDPEGERVGNGGAMLGAMRYVAEREGKASLSGLKVLVMLSSGDSRRAAQYSAMGKVFSPVPRSLPNGWPSTLFDESMIVMSGIPDRIDEGILVMSGDVMLAFDSAAFEIGDANVAALTFPEPVQTGANHGVFLSNAAGNIARVWHKQKPDVLRAYGAVDENNCVCIDTGAVFFGVSAADALFSLVCVNGMVDEARYRKYVNGHVAPSLYVDFFYPLAEESTFEGYLQEIPESSMSPELLDIRREIWDALRPYRIRMCTARPARFIHFGATCDVYALMSSGIEAYAYLDWKRQVDSSVPEDSIAAYCSRMDADVYCGQHVYLEYSRVRAGSRIGDNSILSCIEVDGQCIPDHVVLHGLKQKNGKYVVRIYGLGDNPKQCYEAGARLFDVELQKAPMHPQELWADGVPRSLWLARLYPECDTMRDALDQALNLYACVLGKGDMDKWRAFPRQSLESSFNQADGSANCAWMLMQRRRG